MTLNPPLPSMCKSLLLTSEQIQSRVLELGNAIRNDFPDGDVRFVTVLRGGVFFLADLCRATDLDVRLDFLAVTPYLHGHGGSVRVTKDLDDEIEGAAVIVVEDVIDTGLTLNYVLTLLRSRAPAELRVCALLDKPSRRIVPIDIAYRGFTMGDEFLVGYGLDVRGQGRNLPYVAEVRPQLVIGD